MRAWSALASVMLAAACAHAAAPVVPPPAPPPMREASPLERLTVCVVRNGVLRNVAVSFDPANGDSLYEGRRFRDAFPTDSTFAAGARWYDRNDLPVFNGRRYWSTGLPQAMRPGELVVRGTYRGLTVFVTPNTSVRTEILYLPVRPTCEFQLYQTETSPTMVSPLPRDAPAWEPLTCVVRNGVLTDVPVLYDPATGDSLYEGRRFRDAFPTDSTFAASAAWYHDNEPITALNRMYVKFGLPRALRPGDLILRDRYRGVPVYADVRDSHVPPYLVYLPVRPACEFQPYETEMGGAVRGR